MKKDRKSHTLSRIILFGPLYYCQIFIDRYVFRSRNPFISYPRTIPELLTPPDRTFHLLRHYNIIPADASCVSCEHIGGADTEPDKQVARVDIVYSTQASGQKKIQVFVKLPTARELKMAFKAIVATVANDQKEVAFHNVVFPELARQAGGREKLGFNVPKNLFATWKKAFDRAILIQECVDMDKYHSRPDWMNADAPVVRNIIDSVTDLHRRTWQLQNVPPKALDKFQEKSGVDWLDGGVSFYTRGTPPAFQEIWKAIKKRTAKEPVTISHGDCRLGNCLFTSDFSEVLLTDWEVNSITYYLWDISYCLICSFTPEDRRKYEQEIIRRYLDAIRENPANRDVPSLERAMELHRISLIVVNVFGWLISCFGGVGTTQGNSDNDVQSWGEKIGAAMEDALEDEAALAKTLSVDVSLVNQFRKLYISGKALHTIYSETKTT
jgi:hypothetical protein